MGPSNECARSVRVCPLTLPFAGPGCPQELALYFCDAGWSLCNEKSSQRVVVDDSLGPYFDLQKCVCVSFTPHRSPYNHAPRMAH